MVPWMKKDSGANHPIKVERWEADRGILLREGEVRKRREETPLQFSSRSLCIAQHFIC